ncbi:non-ribosomal peptide synthetase [Mycobacterium angelicum]|uniref:Non-ribosomal peptide synthetase n=1 Tax=Mycobacterium angelicum TaxID=470074 RepID=A0A1W9ZNB5_MYCAN|nr:non-ribosomal peptide synthetase [Mycobacterium angelicum]MCV7199488.1 non-ribosomal peptide synthetase [Mycobacterium angelicum]ORA19327.1 non-ribosomal peptide synthetase [Mycobacterium angelicum]
MIDDARTVQERRRELLRRRIAESGLAAKQTVSMPRVRAGERYPLSAGQRRMWFLQTMDPADATLNICVAYQLTGALDEARLRAAFGAFVERHAVLRTTYGVDSEGEPYQIYSDDAEIIWNTNDLTEWPELGRNLRIESLAREEFGKPVNLTSELPLRVTLIRTGAGEFVLLLVVHHIAWDEECWEVFFGELSAAYNGQDLSAPAPQFVAVEVMESAVEPSISDVGYWADRLRPPPEPLELPGARAAHPSRRSERRTHALPAELYRRVEDFARASSASPLMVLLAAFGVLVRRYTGATDFLVSVPVTERSAAADGAIGYFGNTLLLRITTRSGDTFTSFVAGVREICLDGFAHQSVGIDRVIREINPERMGHDGMDELVRLGFSMRKSANGFALDGITVRQLRLGAVTADLPLALAIVVEPEGAFVEFDHQIDVLSGELADQMRTHYLQLLDSALADPQHRLVNLDMLGAGERKSVLAQSHGELVAASPTTMVALLEAAAAGAPDAVALVSETTELTYAELHGRANRLARWLIGQGFGADDIIGLRMSTSIEFIVAMLAVLKAGAAYLPIDPAYPGDRIEYLVSDARPKAVLGHHELDAAERSAAQLSDGALTDSDRLSPLRPEQLAYVIYTSGSTGQPKGVAVSHQAIAEHVEGFTAEWSMTAEDRLLQSSSVSFDASLLDIFVTLSLGAQLIVPKAGKGGVFSDIAYLADLISRHEVTVLHMVPSMLSTLLMLPQVKEWRQLRHVPVGGEALPGEIADKFSGYFDAKLRNHYGPTEAVVCSTHMSVTGSHGSRVVPIGVPNRNVYAYVLDQELQPVPAEVIGELYLGGAQLARGYLGRPALTAQRFIADPFLPGMRLYRTGDLVRRNVSGELEFVGRADEQVKIRGYRIEPGEIESVIAMHPAVAHCLVVPEDTAAGPILAAYIVPVTNAETAFTELELDEIRGHAASVLPDYMVPGAYAVIPEIPLTVSGKLDRRALPAPTHIAAHQYREPVTATEQRMCAIFARLFGREKVGAEDSFFGLGGHSLLAARLIAQIRAEFGMALDVRTVFDAPTPAGLAAVLVEQVRAEFDIDLDELEFEEPVDGGAGDAQAPASTRPDQGQTVRPQRPPLSYSQLAMWFQHRMRGTSVFFNLALSLRFSGPLDTTALAAALNDVVARHEALRTTFPEHEGFPYQRVRPDLSVDLPVSRVAADQVDEAVAELRRYAFALDSEPLIRPTLLMVDPENHLLLLLIHHIVTDHTSLGVIFEDLVGAYRARAGGQAPGWDALPLQFVDHAVWQQNAFDGPWGQAELAHWRDVLAGLPDEISMGADYSRPPILGSRPEIASFVVPAERRAALAQFAGQLGASEFMVYQAALAVVLHKLGAGSDIAIGSPVAARVEAATARVTGPFANVVVLRNDLSEDPSLRTMVVRCRSTVLDALAHQEFPIDRLVESLNPRRSTSRNHPFFQSSIHLRGPRDWARQPRRLTQTGRTTVVPVPMEFEISLLDLELSMDVLPDGDLEARLVANADLYSRETVALIADALEAAFDAYALTPDLRISALQLLPAAAMERLLAPAIPAARQPSLPAGAGSAETERALIELLEELLDITDVDREDNFFALGGDSIISVQWAARAGERGLALTPVMVFEHLTIAELAAAVDTATNHPVAEGDSMSAPQAEPMSASGLDADALAALSASWHSQS